MYDVTFPQTTGGTFLTGDNQLGTGISSNASAFQQLGLITSIFGGVNGTIGSYFAAQSQQYQARSQAMSLDFQKNISEINAKGAEFQAENELLAGDRLAAKVTGRAGQAKSTAKATMAANGIQLGEGSAAEAVASSDIMKEVDKFTINANAVRAAGLARLQKTNYENNALMYGVSADNMRRSADSISPGVAAFSTFMTAAGSVAKSWYQFNKFPYYDNSASN
jgi:hypothetical protein